MTSAKQAWSLWDMLERLESENLVRAISYLASASRRFRMVNRTMIDGGGDGLYRLEPQEEIAYPLAAFAVIERVAQKLGSAGLGVAVRDARTCLLEAMNAPNHQIPEHKVAGLAEQFHLLVAQFGNELDGRTLYTMGPKYAGLFESVEPLFGDAVADAFPDASYDISEAGKCMAMARWTAAVFHLMRATETAATTLAVKLTATVRNKHDEPLPLGIIVSNLHSKIEEMKPGAKKDAWLKVHALLHSCNRAYRTKTAHPAAKYTEEEADTAYHATRSFLREFAALLD